MNHKKKLGIGIILGVVVSIITLIAAGIILTLLFLFGGPADTVKNVNRYEKTLAKYDGKLRTGLITFPEQIPDSADNAEFYFWYKDTWNNPTVEVFFQCSYNEADYQAEIERLENVKRMFKSEERVLLRGEEGRFSYPVYIAIDAHSHTYEYALLSGENQITYIHTAYKTKETLRRIEEEYLPHDFDSRQEQNGFGEGYNIYLKTNNASGWSCDYSR